MPDLAVMDDLCKLLDISINELLSGEKLSEDSYTRKADGNNIININREKI